MCLVGNTKGFIWITVLLNFDLGDLQIPLHFKLRYIWTKASNIEALRIFLKWDTYSWKYLNRMHRFGRPVPKLFTINKFILAFPYERWGYLVTTKGQKWLSPNNLQIFANAIYDKSASPENYWRFVDELVSPICWLGENHRIIYNDHALNFQPVVPPNGLIANFLSPVQGNRHDSDKLGDSDML